jgi:hypothetical protein
VYASEQREPELGWYQRFRRARQGKTRWTDAKALDAIRTADLLVFGSYGFAAVTLPSASAYLYLAGAGRRVSRGVYDVLQNGTPAGRIYAAHLLTSVDPDYGRSVWRWLSEQPGGMETGSGCSVSVITIGEYARDQLSRMAGPHGPPGTPPRIGIR